MFAYYSYTTHNKMGDNDGGYGDSSSFRFTVDGKIEDSTEKNNDMETPAPPTIQRKFDPDVENTFLLALSKMHGVVPTDIKIDIQGQYKLYTINGKLLFRDVIGKI